MTYDEMLKELRSTYGMPKRQALRTMDRASGVGHADFWHDAKMYVLRSDSGENWRVIRK